MLSPDQVASQGPGGFLNLNGGATDPYYAKANGAGYATIAEACDAVLVSARRNRTVNIAGVEYWWLEADLSDAGLVVKAPINNPEGIAGVSSVNNRAGAVTLTKIDVGLGNVDNTTDAAKPISTATQTALDGKSAVGHTHSYNELTDKPTIPQAPDLSGYATQQQVTDASTQDRARANHTGTQPASTITGLGAVATSNNYNDLSNKPTIPAPYDDAPLQAIVAGHTTTLGEHTTAIADLQKPVVILRQSGQEERYTTVYAAGQITYEGDVLNFNGAREIFPIPFPNTDERYFNNALVRGNGGSLVLPFGVTVVSYGTHFDTFNLLGDGKYVTRLYDNGTAPRPTVFTKGAVSHLTVVAGTTVILDDVESLGIAGSTSNPLNRVFGAGALLLRGSTPDITNAPGATVTIIREGGTGTGGTIENPYTLPTASATILGGVKVGEGLNMTNGVLSAAGQGGTSYDDGPLVARVLTLEADLNQAENDINALENEVGAHEDRLDTLEQVLQPSELISAKQDWAGMTPRAALLRLINQGSTTTSPTTGSHYVQDGYVATGYVQ